MTGLPHGEHWLTLLAPPADNAGSERTRHRLERALAAAGAVAWEWELRAGKTRLAEDLPDAVHPADRDRLVRAVAAAARGEAPYDFEFRLLGANGAIEWVHDLAQLERDSAGRPLRLAGVARLVTAQKRAEAALHATFEQAPIGMAHVSLSGAFTRVNDRLCRFLDRPREVLLSLGFQDVTHPADLAADLGLVDDLRAGRAETYTLKKRYLRGDGAVAWGRLTVSLARDADGAPDHFVALVEDVSEHRTGHIRADTTGGAATRDLPAALAAREEELARVQRIGRIGGFTVDLRDPAFLAWRSPEYRALHALAPGLSGESHEAWMARLHPDDRARADATLRQALASGVTRYENEYRMVRGDGETRWIAASGEIERDPAGQLLRLVGAHQDITDRKRAEMALAEAERQARAHLDALETVYATAPVGLAVFTPDLRYLRINERLAEINGIPAAAHIGRTIREILPEFADRAEAQVRHILDTGEPVLNIEFTGETPAQPGVRRIWISSWTPVRGPDGAIAAINVVAQEVTERRAAEAQTLRLLQIIERANALVATATLDGRVTYMNAAGRRMIGLNETADIGDLRSTDYIMPDSLALHRESVIPAARDKGVWEGELRLVNLRTGAPIEVHRTNFALRDPDGTHSGYGSVTRDITEAKRAAAALAKSEAFARTVLEASPDCLKVVGLDGTLEYLNRNGACLLELDDCGTAVGAKWETLWPDSQRPAIRKAVAAAGEGRAVRFTAAAPTARGTPKVWDVAVIPIPGPDGRPVKLIVSSRDITEQEAARTALTESEARYRAAMHAGGLGTWESDYASGRRTWTPEGMALFGLDLPDGIGRMGSEDDELYRKIHPDDRHLFAGYRRDMLVKGSITADYRIVLPNGDVRWIAGSGTALTRDATGQPVRTIHIAADVTARKATEQALRDSEARFRTAFDTSSLPMAIVSRGEVVYRDVNRACAALFGMAREEMIGRSPNELDLYTDPAQRPVLRALLERDGRVQDFEIRWRTRDGDLRTHLLSADPISLAGEPCLYIVSHDITDRKRAEAALAESEARLRLAMSTAALGTIEWDLVAGTVRMNAGTEALTRGLFRADRAYPLDGPERAAWGARIHPADLSRRRALRAAIVAGETDATEDEYRLRLPADGDSEDWHWIASRSAVVARDPATGRALRILDVFQDITPRRRAEAALSESESLFRATFDQAAIGVAHVGLDGRWLRANDRLCAMLYYSHNELTMKNFQDITHPDDLETDLDRVRALLAGEIATYSMEKRYFRKDGATVWVNLTVSLLRDAAGEPRNFVSIVENISTRKAAETALAESEAILRHTNEELETRVLKEVATREAAQTQLAHSERMQALGQLAGGIAHDFNNVMQAVGGGAALIERRANDAERVRGLARMVAEAVERGAAITRRLLHFSRRADLRAEPVDAAALLAGLREILAATLGAGLDVRIEAPDGLPPLLADKGQLETALINLATNGRDAMAGQGTLTLTASADAVPPGGGTGLAAGSSPNLEPGSYVRLSVSDTGTGMDAGTLARAMEPFFTTKPLDQGTGLGLPMASGFARQSGGDLRIDSALGRGTTVTMWLPVAEAETALATAGQVAGPGRRHARLMLVDDDALVREITARELEEAGYTVLALTSGDEALARLDAGEAVDLIVSDLSMPGMDGVALVREAQRRRPGLPAILLTGFVTRRAEIAVGEAVGGLLTMLRKPVVGKVLAERVAVLLEGRLGPETDR